MGDEPGVVGRVVLCRLWLSAKVFGLHSYCGLNEGQEASMGSSREAGCPYMQFRNFHWQQYQAGKG